MTGSGYSVTLEDFEQLLSYPPYKKVIVPLVEEWFDGTLITIDEKLGLETSSGELLSLAALHVVIQADEHMQYKLYQQAMSLWR